VLPRLLSSTTLGCVQLPWAHQAVAENHKANPEGKELILAALKFLTKQNYFFILTASLTSGCEHFVVVISRQRNVTVKF